MRGSIGNNKDAGRIVPMHGLRVWQPICVRTSDEIFKTCSRRSNVKVQGGHCTARAIQPAVFSGVLWRGFMS